MIPRSGRALLASLPPPPGEPQHEGADQARGWSGAHDRSRHMNRLKRCLDIRADVALRRTAHTTERTGRTGEREDLGDLERLAGQDCRERNVVDAELVGELVLAGKAAGRDATHEWAAERVCRLA